MLRWARGETKKDHVKNEDIGREENIKPMTTFLRQKRLSAMVWPCLQKRRGGYHQEDATYAGAGKWKKGEAQERWLDNIREDMKESND